MRKTIAIHVRSQKSAYSLSREFYVTEEYEYQVFGFPIYHTEKILKGPFWDQKVAKKYAKNVRATKNL